MTKEERVRGFKKEYLELREKYQLELSAGIQPIIQIAEIAQEEEEVKEEEAKEKGVKKK